MKENHEVFSLKCANCAKILKVASIHAGKLGKCPACKVPFIIPTPPPVIPCFSCAHVPPPASVYCPACGARLGDKEAISYENLIGKLDSFVAQTEEMKKEISRLTERDKGLEEKEKALLEKLSDLQLEFERLNEDREKLEKDISQKDELNKKLNVALEEKRGMVPLAKIASLEEDILQLSDRLRNKIEDLEKRLEARPTEEAFESLTHELKATERLAAAREQGLSLKLREFEREKEEKDKAFNEKIGLLKNLEESITSLQEEKKKLEIEKHELSKKTEHLSIENESITKKIEELSNEKGSLIKEKDLIIKENKKILDNNIILQQQLEKRENWFPVSTLEELESRYRGALREAEEKSRDLEELSSKAATIEKELAERQNWISNETHKELEKERDSLSQELDLLKAENERLSIYVARLEESLSARAEWVPSEEFTRVQESYRKECEKANLLSEEIEEMKYSLAERGGVIAGRTYRDLLARLHERNQRIVELTQALEDTKLFLPEHPPEAELVEKLAIESRRANELANLLSDIKKSAGEKEEVVPLLSYETLQEKFFDEITKTTRLSLEVEALRRNLEKLSNNMPILAFKELEQNLLEEIHISSSLALELEESKQALAEASLGVPPEKYRSLEERLEVEKTRIEKLNAELDGVRKELTERETEFAKIHEEAEKLAKDRERLKSEHTAEINELRRAMDKLASFSDNLERGLEKKSKEVISLKSQINRANHTLFTLQGMNERLQAELANIRKKRVPLSSHISVSEEMEEFDKKLEDIWNTWRSFKRERVEKPIPQTLPQDPFVIENKEISDGLSLTSGKKVYIGNLKQIGFDLGTTKTVISYYQDERSEVFELGSSQFKDYRRFAIPSIIGYLEREDRFIFGAEADSMPEKPGSYRKIYSIKRCLECRGGEYCTNPQNQANYDICSRGDGPWLLGAQGYFTWELLAKFILYTLRMIESSYDAEFSPDIFYFTVPISFDYEARQNLRHAVEKAFDEFFPPHNKGDINLIHDITAYAIAHVYTIGESDEIFGVIDIGGKNTTLSLFERRKGELWQLSTRSYNIGGDDLDKKIREIIQRKISRWKVDLTLPEERAHISDLLQRASYIREILSREEKYQEEIQLSMGNFSLILTQEEIEREICETIEKAIVSTMESYDEVEPVLSRFSKSLVNLYLTGGVTKTPSVKRAIARLITKISPSVRLRDLTMYPDTVGLSSPQHLLNEEFPVIGASVGASFPHKNIKKYLIDKLPYEVGVIVKENNQRKKIPFLIPYEKLPKVVRNNFNINQIHDQLPVYLSYEGENFTRYIQYIPTSHHKNKASDIELEAKISNEFVVLTFNGTGEENVAIPTPYHYYIPKSVSPVWVDRMSPLLDYQVRIDGKTIWISGDDIQKYIRYELKEDEPVTLIQYESKKLILHGQKVIGFIRKGKESEIHPLSPESFYKIHWIKEDILCPEDIAHYKEVNPSFRPGDMFLILDIAIT